MTTSFDNLQSQALALSPEERVALADHLLASLGTDGEIETAWSIEVERRLAEIESGRMDLVPLEQALDRARRPLR